MVTVRLKGVHTVKAKLASGKVVEYHYAWRGGPKLPADKHSPEFRLAFDRAHAGRKAPVTGTFRQLLTAYKASPEFEAKGDHSKRAYRRYLDQIEAEFGDVPIPALDDQKIRKHFIRWRDTLAKTPRSADYAVSVLKLVLAWCVDHAEIETNRAENIGRLSNPDKSDDIWTADDFAAFNRHASKELREAVALAAHTGLRQGDLIGLTWGNYDGESFHVRTSKRGKTVILPATHPCRALLKNIARRQVVILTTQRGGRRWTADGLRSSFAKACERAGVTRTFHDIRRTAATGFLISGMTSSEVALLMGWSEASVEALKRKYVSRSAVVQSMLAKLEGTA